MPNHNVAAIANEFLKRARKDECDLTNMQLQKLPYIAHGWGLVALDAPLIEQQPQTWPYGPVYPDLYQDLKRYGAGPVTALIRENNSSPFKEERGEVITEPLTRTESKLLDTVWKQYGRLSGSSLSRITHLPNTPWSQVMENSGPFSEISNEIIKNHYEILKNKNINK
ncbi:Panacea domain-containing protein [Komagataeibacter oboediens]|uniref:Panacea domain-containing protein n=1 Tax=Komagataeibacter oboediens TaxID=65958 RepID=UPI001908BD58|nr:type II toxin-antitoxin system antitoxin SocA domain-containing protein [Komagataeibacter oboediens]